MNQALRIAGEVDTQRTARWPAPLDATLADLYDLLFDSLSRKDQRSKAEQYVNGLMYLAGRKSMRRIASLTGDEAAERNLQHFISKSTWDWLPVRRALGRYLARTRPADAWVVQPLSIPKAGPHSVGVDRRFVTELGRKANVQQAYGLWLASEQGGAPVHWKLVLPEAPADDHDGHDDHDGGIQAAEPPGRVAASLAADVLDRNIDARPVVLDARAVGYQHFARGVGGALPVLARISLTARFGLSGQELPGYGGQELTARQILESLRSLRRPVEWTDPLTGAPRSSLVVAVPVTTGRPERRPGTRPGRAGRGQELRLLGEWRHPGQPPTEAWLTDLDNATPGRLLRLTKSLERVGRDFDAVGAAVGLRDFSGRSYQGWHRHMTLASIASTACRLDELG